MSIYLLALLLGLFSGAAAPVPPVATTCTICPDDAADHLDYVRQFFTAEESRPFREQFGLLGVRPSDVRVLTDEHDAGDCRRMSQAVTVAQNGPYPKVWRGYKAGDFYVMLVTRETPPGVFYHGGGTGLIVLDAAMRIVAAAS